MFENIISIIDTTIKSNYLRKFTVKYHRVSQMTESKFHIMVKCGLMIIDTIIFEKLFENENKVCRSIDIDTIRNCLIL